MNKSYFSLILSLFAIFTFAQNTLIYNTSTGNLLSNPTNFCPGDIFNLSTDVAKSSTGNYSVDTFFGSLTTSGETVSFPNSGGNNHFSKPITLPFKFNFYGKDYTKVVVGSNGRLIFGNNNELDAFYNFADVVSNKIIPSADYQAIGGTNYSLPQIFFGFNEKNYQPTDYVKFTFNYNSKIKGHDAFGVSVIGINPVGNYSRKISASVFLLKDSNEIIISYYETDGSGLFQPGNVSINTVLGIQDHTATKAKWPSVNDLDSNDPNSPYRYGRWKNNQDSYIFTPNQVLTPVYSWKVNNAVKSTAATLNYQPAATQETLDLTVSFLEDPNDVRTSSVNFKSYETPIITETPATGCLQSSKLTVTNAQSNDSYSWYRNGQLLQQTGKEITVNESGNYTAKANGCGGAVSAGINVTIQPGPVAPGFEPNHLFVICDSDGNPSKTVNLPAITGYLPAAGGTVEYYDAAGTVIPDNAILDSGKTKNFTMKIRQGSCEEGIPFSISYYALPQNKNYTEEDLCAYTDHYSTDDFKNKFFPNDNYMISFSLDGINFGRNEVNPLQNNPVFVRVSLPGVACYSGGTLNFKAKPAVTANVPATQLPPRCAESPVFDLSALIPEINSSPNVTVTFHESEADAVNGNNPVNYSYSGSPGTKTLYIRVKDNATGCIAETFPQISLTVYQKPKLLQKTVILTNCQDNYIFNLTQQANQLTDAAAPVKPQLRYFAGTGAEIFGSDITNYDAQKLGNNPKIQIIYNSSCSDLVDFDLKYDPKPAAITNEIKYCDELSFGWEQIKNKIIADPENYVFYESDRITPLRTTFPVNESVDYYIRNKSKNMCFSDLQSLTFIQKSVATLLGTASDFPTCDTTGDPFDGISAFDLSSKIIDFTRDPSASVKFYLDAAYSQEITSPKTFQNTVPFAQTIYLKVESPDYCPAAAKLNLTVTIPTKSKELRASYPICFGDKITVDAGAGYSKYEWSDGRTGQALTFDKPGSYWLKLTDGNCSYTHNFVISDENQPKISIVSHTNDKIQVSATGGKAPYTFYFNGNPSNAGTLQSPNASTYEIFATSVDGCRGPSVFLYNITIPNVITPNADGYNDSWKIENLGKMQNVEVQILDRYGKIVYQSTDGSAAWDGTSAGRVLPTASYWYIVKWIDPLTNKNEVRQGWILLKNRN